MANVAIHNSREKHIVIRDFDGQKIALYRGEKPNWVFDADKVRKNEGDTGKQEESINKKWHLAVEKAELKRKPQSNASMGIEGVFTASANSFMTDEKWSEYLKDCREWAERKFGKENILQWNTHFDETTPHLHIIFIPIIRGKNNKYSSRNFLGGPEGLRQLQTEIFEEVGNKYGLRRGNEGSENKHTNQKEWKRELIKKEKELEKREEEMTAEAEKKAEEIIRNAEAVGHDRSMQILRNAEERQKAAEEKEADYESKIKYFEDGKNTILKNWKMPDVEKGEYNKLTDTFKGKYFDRVQDWAAGLVKKMSDMVEEVRKRKKEYDEGIEKNKDLEKEMNYKLSRLDGKYGEAKEFEVWKAERKKSDIDLLLRPKGKSRTN